MTSVTAAHHTAQLNGTRLHYDTAGEGPPVMLLHGWPQTWYEWRHVIDLLAGEYQVVAPDLRGFGYSGKPAAGYDAATMAADLAALSNHLGLRDVTVLGHDWGAVFGYVYAAKTPAQVRALGIVEMALPGVGVMEQAMTPAPGGHNAAASGPSRRKWVRHWFPSSRSPLGHRPRDLCRARGHQQFV